MTSTARRGPGWGPIAPAQIDFGAALLAGAAEAGGPDEQDGVPLAPAFGDAYLAQAHALAQARQVFLAGNGLPGRWAARPRFTVLEAGFGLGHNFLATWSAWRDDPQRCERLVYVAIEKHPPRQADLAWAHRHTPAGTPLRAQADALLAAWPPATPDIHVLDFDGGRVRLLLALGDIAQVLPELVLQADALYLDGFAPRVNPAMWYPHTLRHLARLAAPGCTVATWCQDTAMRDALTAAGFALRPAPGVGGQADITAGQFAPTHTGVPPPGRRAQPGVRQVAVIGAGLAGAAVARALAAQGVAVTVVEREPAAAQATSGNPGGLFHSVVHGQDGTHARWLRAAALHTQRVLAPLLAAGQVPGALAGLLRGEHGLAADAMQSLLTDLRQPPEHVQVQPDALPGGVPAWRFAGGGWASPPALAAAWLATPGITLRCGQAVQRLQADGARWRLLGPGDALLAEVDAVVLCNAHDAQRLLGDPGWPLQRVRGQTTLLPADTPGLDADRHPLQVPLADGGYALRLADGRVLCGAVSQPGDEEPALRDADHATHLATLRRLTGWAGDVDPAALTGRVGWRLAADDKLPLLGPVPRPTAPGQRLPTQPRHVQRLPGLWLFTALGSRGITQAALGGEVLAAWLTGTPCPLPAALLDAMDPARFIVRQARQRDRDAAG